MKTYNLYEYPGLTFPMKPGFGWSYDVYDTIGFDLRNRSASIWGMYFNRTEFKEALTLEIKIGYYMDTSYSHR